MVDVTVQGLTVPNSPLVAKAYDAGMIRVTDIQDGHVGVLSTFRVDASRYFYFISKYYFIHHCILKWFKY